LAPPTYGLQIKPRTARFVYVEPLSRDFVHVNTAAMDVRGRALQLEILNATNNNVCGLRARLDFANAPFVNPLSSRVNPEVFRNSDDVSVCFLMLSLMNLKMVEWNRRSHSVLYTLNHRIAFS